MSISRLLCSVDKIWLLSHLRYDNRQHSFQQTLHINICLEILLSTKFGCQWKIKSIVQISLVELTIELNQINRRFPPLTSERKITLYGFICLDALHRFYLWPFPKGPFAYQISIHPNVYARNVLTYVSSMHFECITRKLEHFEHITSRNIGSGNVHDKFFLDFNFNPN